MSRGVPSSLRRRGKATALVLTAILGAGVLAGCGGTDDSRGSGGPGDAAGKPELKITGAYVPKPVTTGMAAGFFTVANSGGADTLTSVTSALADRVTLHATTGDTMQERDAFPVPAHGTLSFARGANHLMFEQLTQLPKVGATVPVKLHFKRSGTVTVRFAVKPATYNPATADQAGADQAGADQAGADQARADQARAGRAHPNSPNNAMSS